MIRKIGRSAIAVVVLCLCFTVSPVRAEMTPLEQAYSIVKSAQERNSRQTSQGLDVQSDTTANLSGLWKSSAYPGLQARVVDMSGILHGVVKVPNSSTGTDVYHVTGAASGTSLVLIHNAQDTHKIFIGTIAGSIITGTLTIYDQNMAPTGTSLTGVTLTKDIASGTNLTTTPIAGMWKTTVLAMAVRGEMAMSLADGVGEQIGMVSGSLNVPFQEGTAPYHFTGYYRNDGEIFLCNTTAGGDKFRTLLGYVMPDKKSVVSGVEENNIYFVNAAVLLDKIVPFVVPIILLQDN